MNRRIRRTGYAALAAAALFALPARMAHAYSCGPTGALSGSGEPLYACTGLVEGDSFTVNIDELINADHVHAAAVVSVVDISNGTATVEVDLTNSSNPGGTANRITSFGLGIDPDATGSLTFISGTDALSNFDTSNMSGFQLVEFCATSGANCSGGGSGGLKSGQEDIFQFNLVDGFVEGGTIDLSQFGFKFQGGATSYEIPGCIGIDCDRTPPTQVPTPTALALLSAGILAFSFVGRRRLTAGRSR